MCTSCHASTCPVSRLGDVWFLHLLFTISSHDLVSLSLSQLPHWGLPTRIICMGPASSSKSPASHLCSSLSITPSCRKEEVAKLPGCWGQRGHAAAPAQSMSLSGQHIWHLQFLDQQRTKTRNNPKTWLKQIRATWADQRFLFPCHIAWRYRNSYHKRKNWHEFLQAKDESKKKL